MMVKKVFFLVMFFIPTIVAAQKTTAILTGLAENLKLVGYDEEGATFIKKIKGGAVRLYYADYLGYEVFKYDNREKKMVSSQKWIDGKSKVIKSLRTKKSDLIFYWEYNRRSKNIEIFKFEFSKNINEIGVPSLLIAQSIDKFQDFRASAIEGPHLADDGETIFGTISPKRQSAETTVYTSTDSKLKEFKIQLPAQSRHFKILNEKCDSEGNVYILGYINLTEEKYREINRSKVYLLRVDGKTGKMRKVLVNVGANIKTLNMELSSTGEILVAGVTHLNNKINALFTMRYSGVLSLIKKNINQLDSDSFLTSFTTTKASLIKGNSENEYFYDYKTPVLMENSNGSFSVFIEQFFNYSVQRTYTTQNGTSTEVSYREQSVGVTGLLFDPTGVMIGADRINTKKLHIIGSFYNYSPRNFLAYLYKGKASLIVRNHVDNDLYNEKNETTGEQRQVLRMNLSNSGEFIDDLVYSFPDTHKGISIDLSKVIALDDNEIILKVSSNDTEIKSRKLISYKSSNYNALFLVE